MAYNPRLYDSWYTSSSDSDDEPTQSTDTKDAIEQPAASTECSGETAQEKDGETMESMKKELEAAAVEIKNLQNTCSFWKSECERANTRLAVTFSGSGPQLQINHRQREITQYGCRTCGQFPKKTMCVCPKTKKAKRNT